jgi:prolipoprotein diacylglyceryltransferase
VTLASIPSPGSVTWRLGPLPVRAYAVCVAVGILLAVAVASYRYRRAGGRRGAIADVAAWAVPFGLISAALHALLVATRHDFTHAHQFWHDATVSIAAVGILGSVALGVAGAWIACRRSGLTLGPVAGAAAPALLFGLAVGGLAHWWLQQYYGPPSTWWWAVRISPTYRVPGYESYATFQPVYGYLSLWEVAAGFAVIWAARRFALTGPRTFLLAAACYTAGSFAAESLLIGPLPHILGVPTGRFADVVVFAGALAGLYLSRPRGTSPGRTYPKADLVDDSSGDVMSM